MHHDGSVVRGHCPELLLPRFCTCISTPYIHVCLVAWCNSTPMTASGPTPLRFLVWLGMPKPMIPYPLLGQGVVRTVKSHLGRIPNCSEVPDTPLPPGGPAVAPPRTPLPAPPPPQGGLWPTVRGGGSWRPQPKSCPPPPPGLGCLGTSWDPWDPAQPCTLIGARGG